ncbi:DUF748 domain-containing protein [Marinomonas epiphytica]
MMSLRQFRHYLFYPSIGVAALVSGLWLASPMLAKHYLNDYFQKQGETVQLESLRIDFFPPRVVVNQLVVSQDQLETLKLTKADFEVEWLPLFQKTVRISKAQIDGLELSVSQQDDSLTIAGINLQQYTQTATESETSAEPKASPEEQEQASPWGINLPLFSFTNSQINLSRQAAAESPPQLDTIAINKLLVESLIGQGTEWQGQISINAGLNDAQLDINSQFDYASQQSAADLTITQFDLPLPSLRNFLPAPYNLAQGTIQISGATQARLEMQGERANYQLNKLNLDTRINGLDLALDANTNIRSDLSKLVIKDATLGFMSSEEANAQGQIDVLLEASHYQDAQQQLDLNRLQWITQVDAEQSQGELKVSTKGNTFDLAMLEGQTQALQQIQLEGLQLNWPFTLAFSEQATQLSAPETQLALQGLALSQTQQGSDRSETQANPSQEESTTPLSQSLNLGNLELSLPIEVQQNAELLKIDSPLTKLTAEQLALTQAPVNDAQADPSNQQVEVAKLSLNTPLAFKQDAEHLSFATSELTLQTEALNLFSNALSVTNDATEITLTDLNAKQSPDTLNVNLVSQINSRNLVALQDDLQANYQDLTIQNTLSLQQHAQGLTLTNKALSAQLNGLAAAQGEREQLDLQQLMFNAAQLEVAQAEQQPLAIKGETLSLTSQGLDARLSANKRALAWQQGGFEDLNLQYQDEDFNASLENLEILDIRASEDLTANTALPALANIASLKITDVKADHEGANIKQIEVNTLIANLVLNKDKQLENLVFVEETSSTAPETAIPEATENPVDTIQPVEEAEFRPPYYLVLDNFDVLGDSKVRLQDVSQSPPLDRDLDINNLSVRNVNTQDKEQATQLVLRAKHGKYATLEADVNLWPLADELTMQSKLKVREAELPPYSAYIADTLGYQIDSGQLDLDLDLDSLNGELDGESHITLRQFNLGGRHESSSVVKAGAVPLNIAVGALKDSQDNIELDFPLTGNVDNPEFGLRSLLMLPLRKALFSASSSYLMQTFVPYANVISIAQLASEQILRIRVKPLNFAPGQQGLVEEQHTFLEELYNLMVSKEDSQLKACGVATYQDLMLDTQSEAAITDEQTSQLKQLAELRAEALKEYLVNAGIKSSRVLLCSPKLDLNHDGKPRVELNF